MGNSSSTHEPLEKGFTRGTFGDVANAVGIFIINYFNSYYFAVLTYLIKWEHNKNNIYFNYVELCGLMVIVFVEFINILFLLII